MRKKRIPLLCVLLLVALLGSCAVQKGDYFAPFRGEFEAQLAGEWNGICFEATLSAAPPDERGARVMTLTFYAPSTLSGTVLKKDAEGAITLSREELCLPLAGEAAAGYDALFALFPTTGEIEHVTQENGNTRLSGAGFSLLFAPDGTPLTAENATARATVRTFVR